MGHVMRRSGDLLNEMDIDCAADRRRALAGRVGVYALAGAEKVEVRS